MLSPLELFDLRIAIQAISSMCRATNVCYELRFLINAALKTSTIKIFLKCCELRNKVKNMQDTDQKMAWRQLMDRVLEADISSGEQHELKA
jgi:hypothetical protein